MKRLPNFLPFLLLLVAVAAIGTATLVEEFTDTQTAQQTIYHALWFQAMWAIIVLTSSMMLWRFRRALSWSSWGLHLAFIVILTGALFTSLTSQKGMLHLRIGESTSHFLTEDGRPIPLPFATELKHFEIKHYPGTNAPQDYFSEVICREGTTLLVEGRISMNNILTIKGYRLYQSSYDEDGKGSWLSVNYDPYGTPVTYTGYALLALFMLCMLFSRKGEFRQLLRHPLLKKGGILVTFLLCTAPLHAEPLPAFNRQQADSLGYEQVIYNDRVAPLNTLARNFVQKLCGQPSYKNLSAEQILLGWMAAPEEWQKVPLIKIKNKELRHQLGLTDTFCALEELFNADGTYRLQALWEKESDPQSKQAKAIQEVDEKIGLILMLIEGTLFHPLPENGSVERLPEIRIRAEVLYNRMNLPKALFMLNLTVGFLCFLLFLYRLLRPAVKVHRAARLLPHCLLYLSTAIALISYSLRWYIAGHIPLSNGYETMQFIAVSVLVITCVLHRRLPYLLSFGFLLSGFTLLVAYLGQMNPQITPLMPVLNSPWLSSHVSLIMFSYALYAFTALNAVLALCLKDNEHIEQLTLVSHLLLYPATFCLGIGIFLGAVWANVSWGSYWQWDAKESWALISFLLYSLAFHRRSLNLFRSSRALHIYLLLCFASILMTYFGVNYLLGGMHSYAGA